MARADPATATELLARMQRVVLSPGEAERAASALAAAADLTAALR